MSSSRPFFLFAHGAGAPSASDWMQAWRQRLSTLGDVQTFDYPYMRAGRKTPDRPPVLLAAHAEALDEARRRTDGLIVLIGKSMGSRIGCHVAAEQTADDPLQRVVCLGYPLKAGASGAIRDQVLLALRTPILFVQGTRDPLCPLDLLATVRPRMIAPNQLHIVEGGDHSLTVSAQQRKQAGISQADSDAAVLEVIRRFVDDQTTGTPTPTPPSAGTA
jgi:predicted alpha/beta-hydrolase family hydrolase